MAFFASTVMRCGNSSLTLGATAHTLAANACHNLRRGIARGAGVTLIEFLSHPLVALGAGVGLSLLLYVRQKHLKRFSYEFVDSEIVGQKAMRNLDKLEIAYAGLPIPRVTRTLVRFWNSGKETIEGSDIAKADPLMWQLPEGGQLLSLNLERTSRDSTQIKVTPSTEPGNQFVLIEFDFLDKDDGAVFSILHTAEKESSSLRGTIKGIRRGALDWSMAREIENAIGVKSKKRRGSIFW